MNRKKEVIATYLLIFGIVGLAISGLYFLDKGFTGFVIYEQGNQSDFDEGTYSNTEWGGSAVILSSGQTSGTYTSKVFDAGVGAIWNNLTRGRNEPNVEYLFGVDGDADIFKSGDMGTMWEKVHDDYNGGDGNSGTVYMVSNSSESLFILRGQNLWVSNDQGINWNKINDDFNPGDGNNGLVIEIDGNDNIFIVDGSKEVFKSANSGVSFASINDSFGGAQNAEGFTSDDSNNLFIVDGTADVWKSIDSGTSWVLVKDDYNGGNGNDATDMFSNSSGDLFILHNQDLWASIDSGENWTLINDDFNEGSDSHSGQLIYIDDRDNIYIVDGGEDVFQSTNSGVNFSLLVSDYNGANGNIFGLSSIQVPTNLSFQARNCSQSDCSDGSFVSVDLDNINLQSRYFQYKVLFTTPASGTSPSLSSVNLDYTLLNSPPTISLVNPQNGITYGTNESLALDFIVNDIDGNLDSCWYSLNSGINTSLPGCANITFDLAEGSHTLFVYANDSGGLESSGGISFNVDATGVSVSITDPTGTKTSRTGISISYTSTGNNLTCWYNVETSIGGEVIENTKLANCSSSSFDVASDGDYVLNLYANNTFGSSNSTNSSFTVSTGGSSPPPSSSGGGGGGGILTKPIISGTNKLEFSPISSLIMKVGDSKEVSLKARNAGTNFLNDCRLRGTGTYSDWISYNGLKDLAAGEEHEFSFEVNSQEDVGSGSYNLDIILECIETNKSVSFVVDIIEEKIGFELIKVEREGEDQVKIRYSLGELSNVDQNVELQFLLFDSSNEKIAEVIDNKKILAGSKEDFEILIPVDSSVEGELSLLVNLNSETYSSFFQEDVILGSSLTGLAIFEDIGGTQGLVSIGLIVLFLGFAFFMVRRILKHKKKIKKTRKKHLLWLD